VHGWVNASSQTNNDYYREEVDHLLSDKINDNWKIAGLFFSLSQCYTFSIKIACPEKGKKADEGARVQALRGAAGGTGAV